MFDSSPLMYDMMWTQPVVAFAKTWYMNNELSW